MKPSNLKNKVAANVTHTIGRHAALTAASHAQPWAVPLPRVHPEADPVADPPGSALALQSAGFTDKRLHQGAHLTALVVPEEMVRKGRALPT